MPGLHAVIGANFGDEGKGLMTDYLADGPKSLVIRYNGGAQAGHTVVTPDGKRHIFHHFGSGSFRDAPTFLSEHFLVNPLAFVDELKEIQKLGVKPVVYVDPRARVVTPWDMMMNQAVETKRGGNRHGSCGHGIHETVVRSKTGMKLTVHDLMTGNYANKLHRIRTECVPHRAKELGLDVGKDLPLKDNFGIERHYMEDIHVFRDYVLSMIWSPALTRQFHDLIFEGAQGLRLDEDSSYFPHVTCSKTGLHNVSKMVGEAGLMGETMYATYVTRPYLTRHGAGPLPYQHPGMPYSGIKDETNIPNPWQESLRFAYHDVQEFAQFVCADWKGGSGGMRVDPYLTVTCVDQVNVKEAHWYDKGELKTGSLREMVTALSYTAGLSAEVWASNGPTRAHVEPF